MSARVALIAIAVSLLSVLSGTVRAQAPTWSVTTADLSTDVVTLKSIDATGVHGATLAGQLKDLPFEQFVELSKPAGAATRSGKFDLLLVGGERVNGEPVGIKGDSLIWKNPVAGDVPIPLGLVAAMVKVDGRVSMDPRKEDEVVLANGDVARGAITEITTQQVVLKTADGDSTLPFASVTAVGFATTAIPASLKNKPSFRVRLDEGSTIAGSAVKLTDATLELTLGSGAAATSKTLDLARVTLIEQVNGPVAFLSSQTPTTNVYTPYLGNDQRFLARFNSDFDGNPIRFRDRTYPRSIATHSYSAITWPLSGNYVAFRTRFAMDPKASQGTGGDVTVRVKLDDKVAFEQANVRPGNLSLPVVVELGKAKTLTLEVDYGKMLDSNDRLNWIEPVLLKVKPIEEK